MSRFDISDETLAKLFVECFRMENMFKFRLWLDGADQQAEEEGDWSSFEVLKDFRNALARCFVNRDGACDDELFAGLREIAMTPEKDAPREEPPSEELLAIRESMAKFEEKHLNSTQNEQWMFLKAEIDEVCGR